MTDVDPVARWTGAACRAVPPLVAVASPVAPFARHSAPPRRRCFVMLN
ncbi:hypothetical protein [Sphingopyxis sp. YF1]|nr:hypothetical protein [Sphingopyxis sp. YF1]